MAASCDPEIRLDRFGELISLYKRDTSQLLTPEQVAKCVKFFWLEATTDAHGLPRARASPYRESVKGLKVNVIGGATGAGKTSMINIMAGGMETDPKMRSDTKCPAVYLFHLEGQGEKVYALLDTAGLCDTQASAERNVGLQELLINAVAATVKMYDLKIVNFLMCVSMGERMPGKFADIWPHMQVALGGDALANMCHFVVTKANGGTKVDNAKLKKLPELDFYKELVHSPLKWPVIHAGRDNLGGLETALQPISATVAGFGAESVDPDAQSIETKERMASELEQKIDVLQKNLEGKEREKVDIVAAISRLQDRLSDAYEELASLGNCKNEEKRRLRALIDDKKRELKNMQDRHKQGLSTEQQLQTDIKRWNEALKKNMEQIKKMHGIGAFFKSLVTGAVETVTGEGGAVGVVTGDGGGWTKRKGRS